MKNVIFSKPQPEHDDELMWPNSTFRIIV